MKRKLLSLLVLLMTAVTGAWAETIDLSTVTASKTAQDGDVLTGTLDGTTQKYKISIADGATVTLDGVSINGVTDGAADASLSTVNWAGLTCEGNATIILKEGTTNTVRGFYHRCPGIFIPQGYTLTIEGPGTLNASGSISTEANHVDKKGNLITCSPGIGSAVLATAGNIVINGGTINATGGWASASIGGNFTTGCGNITITGGTVNATGSLAAAGIGGGWVASCGDIVITGGTINATGGDYINGDVNADNDGGPGIGGSPCGSCGNITIGGTANVTATKGLGAPYSIGQGGSWNNVAASCGTVTIFGVEGQISDSPYNATASYNVTANSAGGAYWATFYSSAGNYQAPEGTQVFTVHLEGTGITMTEITDRIVKSGEGVVLKNSTTASITMTLTETVPAGDFGANSLKGTMTNITNPGNAYVLNYKAATGAGFYKLSASGTIGANKAYLVSGAGAPEFFGFDGNTTSISEIEKMRNVENETFYDLQGRRVAQPTKGLYIVNGKKVVIK